MVLINSEGKQQAIPEAKVVAKNAKAAEKKPAKSADKKEAKE